jgi:hypothetical protein
VGTKDVLKRGGKWTFIVGFDNLFVGRSKCRQGRGNISVRVGEIFAKPLALLDLRATSLELRPSLNSATTPQIEFGGSSSRVLAGQGV